MAYKVPKIPPMRELTLGTNSEHTLDGGLCLDEQSSISLTQSPILLNMCLDDGGVPKKRPGQTDLFNGYRNFSFNGSSIAYTQQVIDVGTIPVPTSGWTSVDGSKLASQNEILVTNVNPTAKTVTWNDKTLLQQSASQPAIRDDLKNKISGSTAENPHISKRWESQVIATPSSITIEQDTSQYNLMATQDNITFAKQTVVNGNIPQQLFSFNIVEMVKRKYGDTIGTTLAEQIAWCKANIGSIIANWYGYGSCPSGNKAYLSKFYVPGNTWDSSITNTSSSPTLSVYTSSSAQVPNVIDSNGFTHYLSYTDASNGTIASTVYTDYIYLDIQFKNLDSMNYDVLVPSNPRRDDGLGNIVLLQKSSPNNSIEFFTNNSLQLSTLINNKTIAVKAEIDLNSICNTYYGGSNSNLKAVLKDFLTDFYATAYGTNSGALGLEVDFYAYNYSTNSWDNLGNNATDALSKTTIALNSNHISSTNMVEICVAPKYGSNGTIGSCISIDFINSSLVFYSLGLGKINGIYPNYKGKTIVAWGTGIYTQTGTNDMVLIYNGVTNSKAIFYVYNSMLYFFNGYEFLKYDGTTVSTVTPYIPRHSYNCKPDGSNATIDESWNLIGTGFRRAFNGDGTAKDFTLPYKSLDATAVTAIVDGVNKVEGTDFTVNRATGVVTFTTAPSLSGVLNPNNVEITAYKTFAGYKEQIINCTRVQEAYSVLFLTGNANLPNQYWVGGLTPSLDASYFPFNRIFTYTGTDKACTCFAVHYGTLLIFKEDEFSKIEQVTSPTGISTFNRTNINSEIGCDCPDTMQLINNNPTWLTSYGGVYTLQSSLVPGEKNVIPVSININGDISRPGILQESINDLKNATSFDFNGQYGICLPNGRVYEWEYLRGYAINNNKSMKWYLWDNINASCFFVRDNTLMYGHRQRGQLCKFTDILNDFGAAINAIFSIKLYDFKDPSYEKYVPYCYITTRAGSGSALTVKFIDDQDETVSTEFIPVTETKSFNLDDVDLDNWVWDVQIYAPTIALSPILQSIRYLRIEISNNNINEDLSVVAISLPYQFTRRVL